MPWVWASLSLIAAVYGLPELVWQYIKRKEKDDG